MAGRLNFPGHSLTLIVKGTFDLKPGAKATPVEEQPFPTGDEFYPEDEEQTGAPRYESDFALFKPRADLLLVGDCCPPGGKPAQQCKVTFAVGSRARTLAVFGNRRWEKSLLRWQISAPEPFTRMPLRYENSFGGRKFAANPIGKGFAEEKPEEGEAVWPLPNIEDPAILIESRRSRPHPAGFGPLRKTWQTRASRLGTFDASYRKTRWPWFPKNFDPAFFNAASEELQVEGYVTGNERLYAENAHPVHPNYEAHLPGLRVRCFLDRLTAPGKGPARFEEVQMRLDTVWVDMAAEKLVLLWRGNAPVSSEEFEEVQAAFVLAEPLAQPPASLEQCRQQYLIKQAEAEEAEAFEPEKPPEPEPVEPQDGAALNERRAKLTNSMKEQTAALFSQFGFDPNNPPPHLQEQQARLLKALEEPDPEKAMAALSAENDAQLNQALAKLGIDPNNLPPSTAQAEAERARFLRELGVDPAQVQPDEATAKMWAIVAGVLPKMGMNPQNLSPLIEQVKKQRSRAGGTMPSEDEQPAAAEPKPPPPLTPDEVNARAAAGESLEGADMSGLDLSGRDLSGAELMGVNFSGARMQKTILTGANLSNANLAGADLTEAHLHEADLTGANLTEATLAGAVLDEAVLDEANLERANLTAASAIGTRFVGANLAGAQLAKSNCSKADFSQAKLGQANFQAAKLTDASIESAVGQGINLAGADCSQLRANGAELTGGNFSQIKGHGSIWKGANLARSDFRYAKLEDALFTGACLNQANLSAANAKFARFTKASLQEAKMIQMNLFEGSVEKADLTRADLSGSNLYGAEFLDSILEQAVLKEANVKMTKLVSGE